MHVERLIWDEWNTTHVGRHNVTPELAEEACRSQHVTLETHHRRILLIGVAAKNLLTVILHPEGDDVFYVVTARPRVVKSAVTIEAS